MNKTIFSCIHQALPDNQFQKTIEIEADNSTDVIVGIAMLVQSIMHHTKSDLPTVLSAVVQAHAKLPSIDITNAYSKLKMN